jgi:glycosyltransferase involved in cell wall biosynthesis
LKKHIALLGYYHGPKLGIGVFIEHFIATLGDTNPPGMEFILFTNTNTLSNIGPIPANVRVVRPFLLSLGPLGAILWSALCFPVVCFLRRVDAALIMSNPVVLFSWVPTVSVIHDINELEMPEKYDWLRSFYRRHMMLPSAISNSTAIITVSPFTKEQICRFFPHVQPAQVYPITHPPVITPLPPTLVQEQLDRFHLAIKSYYLVIGRIDPYGKNLYPTIELFRRLEAEHAGQLLVFAGGINESTRADAERFLAYLRDDDWLTTRTRYLGFVDDGTRAALYQGATALIFYSRFEGLGLPLFEAFKLGCPVIINPECRALVDGAEGAAFLVDEPALQTKRRLLLDALYDQSARHGLMARMTTIASRNSWPRCIHAYLDVMLDRKHTISQVS